MLNVAVLIYDQVEVVDMSGPIDVLIKANYFLGGNEYNVYTVSVNNSIVNTENNTLQIIPKYAIRESPPADLIVIPGAHPDTLVKLLADPEFNEVALDWIKEVGKEKPIMTVCSGSMLLGKTGLLDGKKSTTHYSALDLLQEMYPKTKVVKDVKYVEDGSILTTAGVTSGIDGAIYLIKKNHGEEVAMKISEIMEYKVTL